jgi:hypothetical protein
VVGDAFEEAGTVPGVEVAVGVEGVFGGLAGGLDVGCLCAAVGRVEGLAGAGVEGAYDGARTDDAPAGDEHRTRQVGGRRSSGLAG